MSETLNETKNQATLGMADELDAAEVVAFDGQARTITLRFDLMPCAAIGEHWLVRPNDEASNVPPKT